MFKKLSKNIRMPLLLTAIVFVLFVDIFASIVFSTTLQTAYRNTGQKRTERVADSCLLYVNSAISSTYNLSLDDEFVQQLISPTGSKITNKLNNLCNYSLRINAVTVFTANGDVYSSTGVTQLPTFQQLRQVPEIAQFVDGDQEQAVSLRTNTMAGIYDNTVYSEKMGVITCCQKVFNGGEVVAWIFTDILPSTLYSNYIFTEDKYNDAVAYIKFADGYFAYAENEQMANTIQHSSNYFSYTATADNLFEVAVFERKTEYYARMSVFGGVLLGVSTVGVFLTIVLTSFVAKNVTSRLNTLAEKMEKQKL